MPFYDAIRIGASGAGDFEVERSLRFNGADGAFLERTPSSTSNQRKMTFSFWFKRAVNDSFTTVFRSFGNADNRHGIDFVSGGQLRLWGNYNGGVAMLVQPTQVFRDFSAWYHFVLALDTEQGTASNRVKMYINGDQITDFATATYPAQNFDFGFNDQNAETQIGTDGGTSCNFYLAEFHEIDGLQLTPSSFAETNATTGQWVPKDTSALTFGTNGFRLNFSDNSGTTATTLGKDLSGNGNNFTPNNFVVSDAVKDSPTNNFATLDILSENGGTYSEGNLKVVSTADPATSNIGFASSKFYFETYVGANANQYVGVITLDVGLDPGRGGNWSAHGAIAYRGDGQQYSLKIGSSSSSTSYGASYTTGDIIGCAVDIDNDTVTFYKNGVSQGNTTNGVSYLSPTGAKDRIYGAILYANGGNNIMIANFGQDSTFQGTVSAGGNKDTNGIGDFKYTVPSGYKALCSANLPDPTILLPNKHFETLTYTGNGSNPRTISGLQFSPDFVWLKHRNGTSWHRLQNSVVGANKLLFSNSTNAEATDEVNGHLNSFTSDGFIIDDPNADGLNNNGGTYVGWNWNAGSAASKTYRVVVSTAGGSGNKYRFRNSANSATFAADAVTLDLEEGGTYTFDQSDSTMSSHPMQLSTTANGTHGGGSAYSTGVTYELDGSTVTASAFISGFSSATSRKLIITVAASAPTLYYYCYYHSGMGGQANTNSTLGSSNFDGSLQSTVKANTTSGFSIVAYTGNGTSGATVGHDLGVAPSFIITKQRSTAGHHWRTYHAEIGATKSLYLDLTNSESGSDAGFMNNTEPTSTVFSLGDDTNLNENGQTHIAYCFNEVAGYSKIGKYPGNGSSDGTCVFTGFRPAFILIKRKDSTGNWFILDNKRDTFNEVTKDLYPNTNGTETDNPNFLDFLSNGFKLRTTGTSVNAGTMVFLAFAESPFKNSRAR